MALFLDQKTLYRLLQRELPEDVYPDSGRPEDYWSTASIAAKAEVFKQLYDALETVYDNYWPQTANAEGIGQHEIARFGYLSTDLTLEERQDRVLGKMRALPSMSRPDLRDLVESFLPPGTLVRIVNYNELLAGTGDGGTWYLDVSELGVDTYLGAYGSHAFPPGTDQCQMDGSEIGLTPTEWAEYQENAYTYEVQIWDYTPTAEQLADIERELTKAEAAHGTHVVVLKTTTMERMSDRASTSLHLEADYYDGGAIWFDSSGSGNDAVRVGAPTVETSPVFYGRKTVRGGSGKGFHAPNDDFNASTVRTYEVLIDDYGTGTSQFILGRIDGGATQAANWMYKNFANTTEASVFDSTATNPWIGSNSYSFGTHDNLPVMLHVVIDAPNRTIDFYRNGTKLTQNNNFLFGSLATPTGLSLGILGRWNGSALSGPFTGTIMEVLRHEEKFDQDLITSRVAEFKRLMGYTDA